MQPLYNAPVSTALVRQPQPCYNFDADVAVSSQ